MENYTSERASFSDFGSKFWRKNLSLDDKFPQIELAKRNYQQPVIQFHTEVKPAQLIMATNYRQQTQKNYVENESYKFEFKILLLIFFI